MHPHRLQLALTGQVCGVGKHSGGFLWRVEAQRIFRDNKIQEPLGLAVEIQSSGQILFAGAGFADILIEITGACRGTKVEKRDISDDRKKGGINS